MLYGSIKELPNHIKTQLSVKAQEIYLDTFNAIIKEHGHLQVDKDNSLDCYSMIAHAVAWQSATQIFSDNDNNPRDEFESY